MNPTHSGVGVAQISRARVGFRLLVHVFEPAALEQPGPSSQTPMNRQESLALQRSKSRGSGGRGFLQFPFLEPPKEAVLLETASDLIHV